MNTQMLKIGSDFPEISLTNIENKKTCLQEFKFDVSPSIWEQPLIVLCVI
jgi:hypothetical protein